MQGIKQLIATLHPLERKVVPHLKEGISLDELVKVSKLKEIEVMRALQWLENKAVIKINQELKEVINLDKNGVKYRDNGLPERRLLKQLKKEMKVSELDVSKEELNVSLGVLKKKVAINLRKEGNNLLVSITDAGKKLIEKDSFEESFLKQLPIELPKLEPEQKFAYDNLKSRKDLIKTDLVKLRTVALTDLGKSLLKEKLDFKEMIDKLTPQILREGGWKGKELRNYDIKINVPKVYAGRKQHYRAFLDTVRRKFMSLGFTEMTGPVVETEFWNMDALFMPQFHSARDIHDAYYVKDPEYGEVDEKVMLKVKAAHENGFNTGSKGWQYKFDTERTKRLMLRTQGTACSARMLASKDLQVPGKYFGITRCFRSDVVDATHNSDFYQTEGIVLGEGLNFSHLKGLLKMFAEEFAQSDSIKIRPAYFPFTEPSAELFAKHPDLGWIELGGAGVFRPELTKPLGVDVPVIAWGLGIDRLGMFAMGIKDIRQLFSHDLKFLRNAKVVW
ncbi:MAG: phenylalanine--tRNA ligase subunit alpha [Nanoarchaeota archaeon]|nr:phenylalanine--tRNA ligase subunit alpha [Nanoarchaeota archaeon]MBU4351588.1 phenylalanine--tRNA ligase subunit alpha [Nanoarchaeota archaeon]MBU4456629.1 phenylalanine--tRNA ligase subunit alpha [Nanoarchaeota archaeon]MCG2719502.1 phenylalanine--tRNA ligase subunit alpha [Nanoarchaeota archaeon]